MIVDTARPDAMGLTAPFVFLLVKFLLVAFVEEVSFRSLIDQPLALPLVLIGCRTCVIREELISSPFN